MLTVLTVFSALVLILISLVPARPSRPKAMWMPSMFEVNARQVAQAVRGGVEQRP